MSIYVPLNTQHIRYQSDFYNLIKERVSFHTRNGKGNVFGTLPYYLLSTSTEYQISAYMNHCEHCKTYTLYTVKSYAAIILEICDKCGYVKFNTQWYTHQTRHLQNALSDCVPQVHDIMHKHLQEVRKARKWLTPKRKEDLGLDGYRRIDENSALQAYRNHKDD